MWYNYDTQCISVSTMKIDKNKLLLFKLLKISQVDVAYGYDTTFTVTAGYKRLHLDQTSLTQDKECGLLITQ